MRTNPSRTRLLIGLLATSFTMAIAGSASADNIYVDMLTADAFGDYHSRANFESNDDLSGWNPFTSNSLDLEYVGEGIGDSWVTPTQSLVFEHVFSPSATVDSVSGAWLTIWLGGDAKGDLNCAQGLACTIDSEYARIELSDGFGAWTFYEGDVDLKPGTFAIGSVTGSIQNVGDSLEVSVASEDGDFRLKGSALSLAFNGGSAATPEPTAALLFCVGGLLVARQSRRSA